MRTIKFRGKRLDSGEWVYGDIVMFRYEAYITIEAYKDDGLYFGECIVRPDTVGQFTGLFDKNGNEIYEGDIIKEDNLIHKILWIDEASAFCRCDLKDACIRYRISRDAMSYVKVVGNIHDNPEMIKKGGNNGHQS